MRIMHASILVLLAALMLGGCDSSKQTQEGNKASEQVSKEVIKRKAEEPPPPDALAKVGDRYVRLADYEKQLAKLSPKLAEGKCANLIHIRLRNSHAIDAHPIEL